ncbi:hemolysin activation/secretion protein [Erwinia toletana]|uniref:Hemolysin activation/secretion protein n=1 Tax=Winslowiella toletana TaxID=92490 RepID=A0ABS4P8K8_9GAMM|nr:ShlB/FhaC/HecB family hemolysin secretion/activation protein [Winslowiella toletana]MBP2168268.1 hemolysin activation/secretion protein [Winslowiella toletana]
MLALMALTGAPAWAAPVTPAERDQQQQTQQSLLQQNQQQREELSRSFMLPKPEVNHQPSDEQRCFIIHSIQIEQATLLSPSVRERITAPFINQCLGITKISQMVAQISDWYISRGYVTSRAFLVEQDLSSGELHIPVLEGKLQKIVMDNTPSRQLYMAFPGLQGKVLNLRDIEQGMEQINRLRSQPAQIEILPGDQAGYSIVNLTATPEFPLTASFGFDNSGQKSTGTGQLNASLVANNLLGLADKWFIGGGRSSDFSTAGDASNLQTGVSIPWGYGLLDYSYSRSDYRSTFDNQGFAWYSRGDSQVHRLTGNWVVFRNGDMKSGVMAGISHHISRNWLNDALLQSSSRKLTSLQFGINHTQKLAGGVATFNPTLSRGVSWFNAESDGDKTADQPKAQFRKWSLSASFQRPLAQDLWWLSSLYGQWSPDRLYGSERLTLGGESSVRGFKEQYLSGDNGGYLRNEINYTLFTLPVIGQVSALAAVDGGWLQQDQYDPWASGTLWGSAIGLGTTNRYVATQFTLGIPVKYPDWLAPDHLTAYYRISLVF